MTSTTTHGVGSTTDPLTGRPDVADQSVGELVANLTESTTRLLRHEVALAKNETRTEVQATGRAISTLAVAAGIALVALTMLSLAGSRWLSEYLDIGWAYLIVGTLWAVTAAALYSKGRNALTEINPVPERTITTLTEIPNAIKGR
ncbi:MAG TPA: phage holin family protein [Dermatophilaceae bacterium]|nr:phage holin family protein [Dermatophilaceae bacterium]